MLLDVARKRTNPWHPPINFGGGRHGSIKVHVASSPLHEDKGIRCLVSPKVSCDRRYSSCRSIHFAVSRPDLPKDASTHCELVAFVLTNLVKEDGLCLRDFSLTLQCDNTSRECKNDVMMSFLGSLVSKGLLP